MMSYLILMMNNPLIGVKNAAYHFGKNDIWSTGVSTESQNLTSVLHLRQDF